MTYVDHMRELTRQRLDDLFRGVSRLTLTDFPDHPNIGDSAIFAGEIAYFNRASIHLDRVTAIGTIDTRVKNSTSPVVIHGGGNIGGLYGHHEAHRQMLARELPEQTLLIQAPQSISFVDDGARESFVRSLGARARLRIGVRDQPSYDTLSDIAGERFLVPDAVHMLGAIDAPAPKSDYIVVARRDSETSGARADAIPSTDWPADSWRRRWGTRIRKRANRVPGGSRILSPRTAGWIRLAESRLGRGVEVLSSAETVITDRLHAMLISLQMGRNVIAIDNANFKLSRYAETWFEGSGASLQFAPSVAEAVELASR